MEGVLLNPITGRPEPGPPILGASGKPLAFEENAKRGWRFGRSPDLHHALERAPENVRRLLDKARDESAALDFLRSEGVLARPMMAAGQFFEMMEYAIIADGTAVTNTTTETIMVPDFTIPANWMYPLRALKYTVIGRLQTVITTPGTVTARLRWGGVAGTSLCASGAFAPDPTAASSSDTVMFQWYVICRSIGSSGSLICAGPAQWGDFDDASATTLKGNLDMGMMPTSALAAVTVNTLSANALSPTINFSVATATTSFTAHMAFLESLS